MKANYIAFWRKLAKLTQKKLAIKVNISLSTLIRWEKGASHPRASDIRKLCVILNIDEGKLLNGPQEEVFQPRDEKDCNVTLKFTETLKGSGDEMQLRVGISLTVADDGFVGVSGGRKLENRNDIEVVMTDIRMKLEEGLETRKRLAEKKMVFMDGLSLESSASK